jgi:putative protein-disulfide isomerase
VTDDELIYLFDPYCGWCYAAAPLVDAACSVLPVSLWGGGLMAGEQRMRVSDTLRTYVMTHDKRIAALTGQPFGERYFDGLLRDSSATFDSEIPIAAMMAAQSLEGRGLEFVKAVQRAHFVDGRRTSDAPVILDIAASLGIDAQAFASQFEANLAGPVREHISQARRILASSGAQGFPTLILQGGGTRERIDATAWLGRPNEFRDSLSTHLRQRSGNTS